MTTPADPDWYAVLGVDPSASDAEIGRAFRGLARRYHPDVGTEASGTHFSDVAQAYEVLGQRSRRADYDRVRSGPPASGIRIPVRRWAGAAARPPSVDGTNEGAAGQAEIEVSVSFAEAVTGTTARVDLPEAAICRSCAGSGRRAGDRCSTCGGEGRKQRRTGSITIRQVCEPCGGTGSLPPAACEPCHGRGWTERHRRVSVRVPSGVLEGTRLRLRGREGKAIGFARVRIRPDPWLSREGRDLVLRLPVSVAEAALGTSVTAILPDGPVEIPVPPGTQPGAQLRVAGRGISGSGRGDLVALVEVSVPEDPGEKERAALQALLAVTPSPRRGWPATPEATSRQPGASGGDSCSSTTAHLVSDPMEEDQCQ